MCLKSAFKSMFIDMLFVQWAMGWPDPPFLSCLTGLQPGTQKGPWARAWAGGQARRPVRHGPQGTTCPLGLLGNVPGRPVAQVYIWPAVQPGPGLSRNTGLVFLLEPGSSWLRDSFPSPPGLHSCSLSLLVLFTVVTSQLWWCSIKYVRAGNLTRKERDNSVQNKINNQTHLMLARLVQCTQPNNYELA